jgi:hypothetical protein
MVSGRFFARLLFRVVVNRLVYHWQIIPTACVNLSIAAVLERINEIVNRCLALHWVIVDALPWKAANP